MLESLVASLLNRFLGSYVSNLNYDQLNIGIWNGEAHLRDLKLRREALDKLDLPINVVEGYLGELKLIIPWSNLKTKPVKVFIENVYLLAAPKSESTISLEDEEERAQMLKQRRLATADILAKGAAGKQQQQQQQTNAGNDGFISQLTTKIVDNLQVSIKNIHVRFEDHISDPGHPFAAGITLKELSAFSTDGEWKPTFISEATNTIHKLATLQSLSVYWNTDAKSLAGMPLEKAKQVYTELIPENEHSSCGHQYILKPVSGTGKIKFNKQFGGDTPKTDVILLFDQLGICLDDHQYRDAILLIDLFHANIKKRKYLKFHPPPGTTPKSDPRAYLRFAGNAILSEIRERNYKWTWDHFRTRRDQRLAYVECYTASQLKQASQEQMEKLKRLERELSFEDIRFYRSIARTKLKREKIKIEEEKKKNETSSVGGWLSSWWYGSGKEDLSNSENDDNSIVITDEQKKELYDAIEYDEEKAAIAQAVDMPKDTKKFVINTKLQRGSLALLRHSHTEGSQEFASLVFDTVTANVVQYMDAFKIEAALGDLRLYDGLTKNTLYRQLIGVKDAGGGGRRASIIQASSLQQEEDGDLSSTTISHHRPFFSVVYENKPLNHVADNAVSLKMRHLEIVHNPGIVKGIMDFFKPPENKAESINALLEVAGDTIEGFKQQTRAGLQYALEQHTTFVLDVDMDAPIIIIPESYTDEHAPALILDAGHIQVESDLANQEMANEYKTKAYTKEDLEKLESLMYDKFNVQLSQTKLLIGPDIQDCLLQQQNPRKKNSANIIERIDIAFTAELCILQGITQFPKFKLSGQMPVLSLNVSDTKYKILMRMIDKILESTGDSDQQQTASTTAMTGRRQQNLLALEFLGDSQQHQQPLLYLSDTDSEGGGVMDSPRVMSRQVSRQGSQEEPLSKSFQSSASTASIMTLQQEQFRFSFQVGKVSASLHQTAPDNAMNENLLCEIILDTFSLEFVSRPYDMAVDVSLKSLSIIDEMKHGHEFRYLVTSNRISGDEPKESQKELVRVKYKQVKREHPLFEQEYQGFNQSVDIALSTLNVVVTRSSILTLYNFVLDTFTGPPQDAEAQEEDEEEDEDEVTDSGGEDKSISEMSRSVKQPQESAENGNSIKVKIHLDSVDLILNNDGTRLGTGVLSYGDLTVLVYPKTLKVTGRFGNFSLTDDTKLSSSIKCDYNLLHGASDVYLLCIQGEELASFCYETFDENDKNNFPGYHQTFRLRMGAVKFNFLDTAKPTLNFLNEFLQMKTVYDAARMAAVERAQQLQETRTRFHFDILIKSPIVVFPVGGENNEQVLAYLGEIRAINKFVQVSRRHQHNLAAEPKMVDMSKIECGLYAISMESSKMVKERERKLPIIDNLDISFDILSPELAVDDVPGPSLNMTGKISDVRMTLTETQYAHLLLIYNKVMDFISSPPEENNNNNTKSDEQSSSAVETSSRMSSHTNHTNRRNKTKVAKKDQQQVKRANIQMALDMSLKTVCLEVLTGPELVLEERHKQRLAFLAFNGTSMKFQSMSDASMLLEVQMESIAFTDTRPKSNSKFKEIMAPSHLGSPQLQVQLKMPAKDDDHQIMQVLVAIDTPKVILSLDYVFLLRDFFMKPFTAEQATDAQTFAETQREQRQLEHNNGITTTTRRESNAIQTRPRSQKQQLQAQTDQAMQLQYRVNVVDVQLVCLAKPESAASEAVIFSIKDIEVIQRKQLSCRVSGINMRLCRMDIGNETSWSFIQEFDVVFSMETSTSMPGRNITVMEMDVQPLVIHLSFHDAMIITAIANKALELMGNASQGIEEQQQQQDDTEANTLPYPGQEEEEEGVPAIEPRPQEYVEPYIVMSKESLVAKFQGIQFVMIEDLHDLPFIDASVEPFSINVADWSRALSVDVGFNLQASNFNFRNSHWEPIIEPWKFSIKVSQDPATKALAINVKSTELLNVNLTHAFLETMLSVSNTMIQAQALEGTQKQVRPYLIHNKTGYPLHFWNMSDDAPSAEDYKQKKSSIKTHVLENKQEFAWTFRDWKSRRERTNLGKNLVGVRVDAFGWEALKHIPLDQEGQHAYRMEPALNGVSHRLIVDIKLENHVKRVTFRSGLVLQNRTKQRVQYVLANCKRELTSNTYSADPGQEVVIPIGDTYSQWVLTRPDSNNYEWSWPALHWSDLTHPKGPRMLTCKSKSGSDYIFQLNAIYDKRNPVSRQYPYMTLQFCPPFEVENLLPVDFDFSIVDKSNGQTYSGSICKGESAYLHSIHSGSHVAIGLSLSDSGYQTDEYVDVDIDPDDNCTRFWYFHLKALGKSQLTLHAKATEIHSAVRIGIFAPYFVLNKTGLPVQLKARDSFRQSKHHVYDISAFEGHDQITPVLFSFDEVDRKNRVQLSIEGSNWSEPLSFEVVGSTQDVSVPESKHGKEYHVGIKIEEGTGMYHLTKLVTLAPRFIIKNNLDFDLAYREFGASDEDGFIVPKGGKIPVHKLAKCHVRWLSLKRQGQGIWSSPFDLQQIGIMHVKLERPGEDTPFLAKVSTSLQDASIFITVEQEKHWPFLISNRSSTPVTFYQEANILDEYRLTKAQEKALPKPREFSLAPNEIMEYSWDMPVSAEKRVILVVNGKKRSVNFQAIGTQIPFRYRKSHNRAEPHGILSIDVIAHKSALVLALTDFNPSFSLYRPKSSAASTTGSTSGDGSMRDLFETVDIEHVTNYTFKIDFAGMGISIVNKRVQEMAYVTIKGLNINYEDSNLYQSIRASIQWLQIDNQFYGSVYPILCFPTTLPKESTEQQSHPTLHLALDKVKDQAHGAQNYKLFSILLQEMTFEMDEDFLYGLLEFSRFSTTESAQVFNEKEAFTKDIPEPPVQKADTVYYFQEFYVQPMRLNLSFMRTPRVNATESEEETRRSPMRYIFDVFTMTIGNVNDAPIKLNALFAEDLRVSWNDLINRITLHYRDQVIFQVHKVLGSVDILGNPVGLFSSLSSGVGELFYEPYQGFILSDRPQDLGIGIARGVGGFVKKGVFGVTDSLSRFTGSVSKGLSVATMDKKFQDKRRIEMARNKPKHAMYGVTQGVIYFGSSIASGVTGLVERPLEGARSGGIVGFAGGVGRGLVGVVTKPLVGMFDFASNVTAGVRETTTVFDVNDIGRERLPRFVGKDTILRPFSQREALGQLWLKELEGGKYFADEYIAHCTTQSDQQVLLLTFQRILLADARKLEVVWSALLDNISECNVAEKGIVLHVKSKPDQEFEIQEGTSRKWFAYQIQNTLEQRKEEKARQ